MVAAPIFGWLADRIHRGGSSLASACFCGAWCDCGIRDRRRLLLCCSRCDSLSALAKAATALLLQLSFRFFPIEIRGRVLSYFYVAIPVGSALGYAIGGFATSHWGWQTAFFAVAPPGVLLGLACFLRRDPRDEVKTLEAKRPATLRDYARLIRIRSYV